MKKRKFIKNNHETVHQYSLDPSFLNFIRKKEQRRDILILVAVGAILYLIMHILYPTPFNSGDTYDYIGGALTGFNKYRPIGYSKALIFFHLLSSKTSVILLMQFTFHFLSSSMFVLTLKYFFPPKGVTEQLIFLTYSLLAIFSPSILYLSNYVVSDSIFISLTTLWITTLIWLIHKPFLIHILLNYILLLAILQVRYSGLFYPLFSIAIITLSIRKGILGILIGLVPLLITTYFYFDKKNETKAKTNVNVFSPFGGWQLANNALHILPYINLPAESFKDDELTKLHRMTRVTNDSVYKAYGLTYDYIWAENLPLKQYCFRLMQEQKITYLQAWSKCGVIFSKYGTILIIKYPIHYAYHFLLPNLISSFYPIRIELLAENNIIPSNNNWFDQGKSEYKQPSIDLFHKYFIHIIPILVLVQWIFLFISIILGWKYRNRIQCSKVQFLIFILLISFLTVYMCFHIFSAPMVLRFELVVNGVLLSLIYILVISIKEGYRIVKKQTLI